MEDDCRVVVPESLDLPPHRREAGRNDADVVLVATWRDHVAQFEAAVGRNPIRKGSPISTPFELDLRLGNGNASRVHDAPSNADQAVTPRQK
jgi:hypothetical protein